MRSNKARIGPFENESGRERDFFSALCLLTQRFERCPSEAHHTAAQILCDIAFPFSAHHFASRV